MPTRVVIVDYDPSWPLLFAASAERLRGLLGGSIAAVDHVGSTAVAGLSAKPLIDIDLTLCADADIAALSNALIEAGYEPRGSRHGDGVIAFLLPGVPGERLYLCPAGSETHRRRIMFRDRLRSDHHLAQDYERLKRRLAIEYAFDGDGYTAAKGAFIQAAVESADALSPPPP